MIKLKIVIPIFDCIEFDKMDKPPTAHQVAMIITEACKVLDFDPATFRQAKRGDPPEMNRVRAYAGTVIRALFSENGSVGIGRMVGAARPSCFMSSFDYSLRNGGAKWWNDHTFMGLVEACERKLG